MSLKTMSSPSGTDRTTRHALNDSKCMGILGLVSSAIKIIKPNCVEGSLLLANKASENQIRRKVVRSSFGETIDTEVSCTYFRTKLNPLSSPSEFASNIGSVTCASYETLNKTSGLVCASQASSMEANLKFESEASVGRRFTLKTYAR